MAIVLLVRHGRTTANASGVLAGQSNGVHVDDVGRAQVRALAERLRPVPVAALISSPLERCLQTAELLGEQRDGLPVQVEDGLIECGYGEWTGRPIKELRRLRLWRVVQSHPSGTVFPGPDGESLREVQARAVDAIRSWDSRVEAQHGPDAITVAVSHADVIKAVVADAIGLHLDLFQRLVIDPASVTIVRYTEVRPFLVRLNDTGGDLSGFRPKKRRRRATSDAVVGGGAGVGDRPPRP